MRLSCRAACDTLSLATATSRLSQQSPKIGRVAHEQLPSGSMMRVLLMPSFHQITLMLSGIQCAGFRRNDDGTEEAQPFAREARYFVETRLSTATCSS